MTRPSISLQLHLRLTGRGNLTRQIYQQLREAVAGGRLRPGDRVPSTRELAQQLSVARNTVGIAYEQLIAEGFFTAQGSAGTFVSDLTAGTARRNASRPRSGIEPPAEWLQVSDRMSMFVERSPLPFDFRPGLPDARLFPADSWRRLVSRALRRPLLGRVSYSSPAGDPELRASLAHYVGLSRRVTADPEEVVVTSGAQQGLDLIARVWLAPGDCAAVEEPGYPPARMLLRSLGARVVPVPVDDEGLCVDALPARARLVYVTPSHQFPLGVPMSLERRMALLAWADAHRALIVEDDYDGELRFAGRPLEPLHALDASGRVVYLGSFSKTLLPELRLGFIVAPPAFARALAAARGLSDWHSPPAFQYALSQLIDRGLLARHVRKAIQHYRKRREIMLRGLEGELSEWLSPTPGLAGLHVCALGRKRARVDVEAAARRGRESGLGISTLHPLYAGRPDRRGLLLGYGRMDVRRLREGLERLTDHLRRESAQR